MAGHCPSGSRIGHPCMNRWRVKPSSRIIDGIIPVDPVMAILPWVIILPGASGSDSCGTVDIGENCGGTV